MISIVQVALGGLAPPILAVHVALAGLAPFEQITDQTSGGGSASLHAPRKTGRHLPPRPIEEDEALLFAVLIERDLR